jgi:RNA-directed DNA polymerase
MEGKMTGTSCPESISTKLNQIAKLAAKMRGVALTTLAHHIDIDWLREAHRRTRKNAAAGVDEQTASEYAVALEENLQSLLTRAKAGWSYRAPPVRRVHIPKGDGSKTRPIGIPTFEDKILQRSVLMALEAVYEQEFYDFSYGFRPARSPHQALQATWKILMDLNGGWVLEADIEAFFDSVDHGKLQEIVSQRVRDGVLLRLIGKWLNAGVLEDGNLYYPDEGTPQGGVISPLLANIYLHEVLDKWFAEVVRPRLTARAHLVRFADDFIIVFEVEEDARRVHAVLEKRFSKYGLRLHPEKTRLFDFRRPPPGGKCRETFDFLGFTHFWGRSQKGNPVVRRKTATSRFSRALRSMSLWMRANRHMPLREQQRMLGLKLRGHYGYYGLIGNSHALGSFLHWTRRLWRKWLARRSWHTRLTWPRMTRLLEHFPLPKPVVVYSTHRAANQ